LKGWLRRPIQRGAAEPGSVVPGLAAVEAEVRLSAPPAD
jgi:hypothetical protein